MKNPMPFTPDEEGGKPTLKTPGDIAVFMPDWPNAQNDCVEYVFGFLATHTVMDEAGLLYRCYISNTHKLVLCRQNAPEGNVFLQIRKRNIQESLLQEDTMHSLDEIDCAIVYYPSGETLFSLTAGTEALILIDINDLIVRFLPNLFVKGLLLHIQQQPATPYALPVVKHNTWLHGLINLLWNTGKDTRHIPELHTTLLQILAVYMSEIDTNMPVDIKYSLQFSILTRRVAVRSLLLYQSRKETLYKEIIHYLLTHLKVNYDKKTIAAKSGLGEKSFSRLFRDGYGKPFKEGYLELRLTEVFKQVTKNGKLSIIARNAGYTSASNLSVSFKKMYGFPPSLFQWPYRVNAFVYKEVDE